MSGRAAFPALGTTAVVVVNDAGALAAARSLLAQELDALDRACSRFRADSELSRANARAGRRVPIGRLLADAVAAALEAARLTDGLVDPTLGRELRRAGYDRTFELVRAREGWRLQEGPRRCSKRWLDVELDLERRLLLVPRGCELDLGATAKALCADRAAALIARRTECGALVSLGGDIAVAGEPPTGGWCVQLADHHAATLGGTGPRVAIRSGGLATSSTTVRRWPTSAGEAHHLLHPATGLPAVTPWRTVSVAAARCLDANIASTAAIVLGMGATEWLRERSLPARLVGRDGEAVHVGGWPADPTAQAA